MTFNDFLKTCHVTDNPRGDFLEDMRADSRFPAVSSWNQLETYLMTRGACSEAIAAGKALWKEYTRTQK